MLVPCLLASGEPGGEGLMGTVPCSPGGLGHKACPAEYQVWGSEALSLQLCQGNVKGPLDPSDLKIPSAMKPACFVV